MRKCPPAGTDVTCLRFSRDGRLLSRYSSLQPICSQLSSSRVYLTIACWMLLAETIDFISHRSASHELQLYRRVACVNRLADVAMRCRRHFVHAALCIICFTVVPECSSCVAEQTIAHTCVCACRSTDGTVKLWNAKKLTQGMIDTAKWAVLLARACSFG